MPLYTQEEIPREKMMEIEEMDVDGFSDIKRYQRSDEAPRETSKIKEIGDEAIWTLSTAKTGNGV